MRRAAVESSHQQDELNKQLLTAQGPQAAEIAKSLSRAGLEIEKLENSLLDHMENLQFKELELSQLKGS